MARATSTALVIAVLDGAPDDAEAAAVANYERHVSIGDHAGPGAAAAFAFVITALMRGSLDALLDTIADNARDRVDQPINPASHVWALALTGRTDEARRLLPDGDDDERLTNPFLTVSTWTLLAEAAARCDVPVAASAFLELLRPCRDRFASVRAVPISAVAHATGLARACLGDLDAAVDDLEHAIDIHEGMRAPFHVAYSQAALADVLVRRGSTTDRERARSLATAALDVSRKRNYGYVIRDASAVLDDLG